MKPSETSAPNPNSNLQPQPFRAINEKNQHLEALRGVLALMVLISHVSLIRYYFGRSDDYLNPIIFHLGRVAVTGFFVLSGYLITLSILGRMKLNNWSIRSFYIGRMFRIWPLYFLVIVSAIWILPSVNQLQFMLPEVVTDVRIATSNRWYFLLFMPQVPLINNAYLPFAEPTWSIGVEEIFYLTIPLIILVSKENLKNVLIVFILTFIVAKYSAIYLFHLPPTHQFAKLLTFYRYDCVALGCLLGVLQVTRNKVVESVNGTHLVFSVIALVVLFKNMTVSSYDYFPFAICFAVIIAYLANKRNELKSPKWLVHIGTVSFSLYLTHELCIVFLVNKGLDQTSMTAMYAISILLAILLASLIYLIVEKPFMKLGRVILSNSHS
jgi:peptidoglycan/LPS O-acetylase OafA/YrhL